METESTDARQMNEMIDLYNLKQHVTGPTHIKGHTLDIIITPNKDGFLQDLKISENDLSHHHLINFNIVAMTETSKEERKISFRCIRNVDLTEFRKDVQEGLNALPETSDLVTKMNNYNSIKASKRECIHVWIESIPRLPDRRRS